MELYTHQFEADFRKIAESIHDIGTQNVLYHYTGMAGLFGILDSGRLSPYSYALSTGKGPEIAVTRSKRPLSSIENSSVRIALFTDRIKTLRGVTITGINEAEQEQRRDYEASVAKLLRVVGRPTTGYARVLYSRRDDLMDDPEVALDVISDLCMLDRRAISRRDLEDFLINLTQYAMIRNKEYGNQFEERIRTSSGIPVDRDYMEIAILRPDAVVPEGMAADECVNLLKDNALVFLRDDRYDALVKALASITARVEKKRDLSGYSSEALRAKYPAMFS